MTTSQPQNLNPYSLTALRNKGSSFGSYTTSQPQNLNPYSLTALRSKGSGFSSTKKQAKRRGSGSLGKVKKSENNQVKIPF